MMSAHTRDYGQAVTDPPQNLISRNGEVTQLERALMSFRSDEGLTLETSAF